MANHCYPIKLENDVIFLALEDDYNEDKLLKFIHWARPYQVRFVMIENE